MIKAKIIEITSEPDEVIVKENFSSFSIELETRHKIDIEDGKIEDVIDQINSNDNFSLTILIDNGEILTLNSQDKLDGFLDKLDKDFKLFLLIEKYTSVLIEKGTTYDTRLIKKTQFK